MADKFLTLISGVQTLKTPLTTSAGAGSSGALLALNGSGAIDATAMPGGAPIATSAGAGSAGTIPKLNSAGAIDATMMPSGVGANSVSATASATITAGQLVNIYNNAGALAVRPADNTAAGSEANGYATAGITSGASGSVNLGPGSVTGLTGLTLGSRYYLGTVGAITTTAPSTTNNVVQAVGIATSTTALDFQPAPPVTLA